MRMSYNNGNRFYDRDSDTGGARGGRRYRSGVNKNKATEMKWNSALEQLKDVEEFKQKVNVLDAERQLKLEQIKEEEEKEEQKIIADAAVKAEEEEKARMTETITKVLQEQCKIVVVESLKAAKQAKCDARKKLAEKIAKEKESKSWLSWLWPW